MFCRARSSMDSADAVSPREASRRCSHSGSPGTDHRSSAPHMVCSPHCEFERVRHHAKHAGAASAPKFARKTSKPFRLRCRTPKGTCGSANVPGDPFGAVAPENDPFLKVDHQDSDLQALPKPSTNLGILKGRHSLDRQRRTRTSPSVQSTATSENEPCCALRKTRKSRCLNKIGIWHFRGVGSTSGLFSLETGEFNFTGEQFWGRAARASRTRKSLGTLVILGKNYLKFLAETQKSRAASNREFVEHCWSSMVRRVSSTQSNEI